MFRLESYVTPYILAYLGKYFKNFNPADFTMSLWSGGAMFQNLDLDLEVLQAELLGGLPQPLPLLKITSGHIHSLQISIPWTKVTSEPITIRINTMEITFKADPTDPCGAYRKTSQADEDEPLEHLVVEGGLAEGGPCPTPSSSTSPGAGGGGYMSSLIKKILTNIHVTAENVIVKVVTATQPATVLSFHVKRAAYSTADQDWSPAFIDFAPPSFILRKLIGIHDLTACLDEMDGRGGWVGGYQEPLLHRVGLEVQVMEEYRAPFGSMAPFSSRMDVHLDDVLLSVTDEQIPMAMGLYFQIASLLQPSPQQQKRGGGLAKGGRGGGGAGQKEASSSSEEEEEEEEEECGDGSGTTPSSQKAATPTPGLLWSLWDYTLGAFLGGGGEGQGQGDGAEGEEGEDEASGSASGSPSLPPSEKKRERDEEEELHKINFFVNKIRMRLKRPLNFEEREEEVPPTGTSNLSVRGVGRGRFTPFLDLLLEGLRMGYALKAREFWVLQKEGAGPSLFAHFSLDNAHLELFASKGVEPTQKLAGEVREVVLEMENRFGGRYSRAEGKVRSMRLAAYQKDQEEWAEVPSLGLLITSIPSEIKRKSFLLLERSFHPPSPEEEEGVVLEGMNKGPPGKGESSTPPHLLTLTFTRVQASNYYQRLGIPSPFQKWREVLQKYREEGTLTPDLAPPPEEGDEGERYLSEVDLKMRALDILLDAEGLAPFTGNVDRVLGALSQGTIRRVPQNQGPPTTTTTATKVTATRGLPRGHKGGYPGGQTPSLSSSGVFPSCSNETEDSDELLEEEGEENDLTLDPDPTRSRSPSRSPPPPEGAGDSSYNNNTLPLLYVQTEEVRLFLKGANSQGDFILISTQGLRVSSINETPDLAPRTILHPALYEVGRSGGLLPLPGSPIEDRCYTLTFPFGGGSAPLTDLFLPGKVIPLLPLLLPQGEVKVSYSPSIVLENNSPLPPLPQGEGSRSRGRSSILVAGHALEVNVMKDLEFTTSLNQLDSLLRIGTDFGTVLKEMTRSLGEEEEEDRTAATCLEADVGKERRLPPRHPPRKTTPNSSLLPGTSVRLLLQTEEDEEDEGRSGSSYRPALSHGSTKSRSSRGSADAQVIWKREKTAKQKKKRVIPPPVQKDEKRSQDDPGPDLRDPEPPVPFDLLLTSGVVSWRVYEVRGEESVRPLLLVHLSQPIATGKLGGISNNTPGDEGAGGIVTLNIFDIQVRVGSEDVATRWIPAPAAYHFFLFDSLPGDRDPKTGLTPPLLTLSVKDPLSPLPKLSVDIGRPLQVDLTLPKRAAILYTLAFVLDRGGGGALKGSPAVTRIDLEEGGRSGSGGVTSPKTPPPGGMLGGFSEVSFSLAQVQVSGRDKCSKLTGTLDSVTFKANLGTSPTDPVTGLFSLKGLALFASSSSSCWALRPLLPPFSVGGEIRWSYQTSHAHSLLKSHLTRTIMTIRLDPITIYANPANIKTAHQIYLAYRDLTERQFVEDEIIEIMEEDGDLSCPPIIERYEDDLRSGSFAFLPALSPFDLPPPYTALFCRAKEGRTLTWRYPQPRMLESVTATPVPLPLGKEQLDCVIEYWEDAAYEFRFFSWLTIKDGEVTKVERPGQGGVAMTPRVSTIWRVKILTPLNELDAKTSCLLGGDVLAACLRVDSFHTPTLIPRLKIFVEAGKILFSLGHSPGHSLSSPPGGPYYGEEWVGGNWGELRMEASSTLLSVYKGKLDVQTSAFLQASLIDYEFLTMLTVMDPSLVTLSLTLEQRGLVGREVFTLQSDFFVKDLTLKIGASGLHTLTAAASLWTHAFLQLPLERHMNLSLAHIQIVNSLPSEVRLIQVVKGAGSVSGVIVPPGGKVPFFWCRKGVGPTVLLSASAGGPLTTPPINLKTQGYQVRTLGGKQVLVHVKYLGNGIQRLVTISGTLVFGNALEAGVEVGMLGKRRKSERNWVLPPKGDSTMQVANLDGVEHLRFRFASLEGPHPWSPLITPGDFNKKPSIPLQLFMENAGRVETYCVWITLITEKLELKGRGSTAVTVPRWGVILSPFFRVLSLLPMDTLLGMKTMGGQGQGQGQGSPQQSPEEELLPLQGQGVERELPFSQNHTTAHHLTLQSIRSGCRSSPSIPLLPEGPVLTLLEVKDLPLDDILADILGAPNEGTLKKGAWPYLPPEEGGSEWKTPEEGEESLDVQVEFRPWLSGLPTVLLEIRPWALLLNLSGAPLLFSSSSPGDEGGDLERILVPTNGAHPPRKLPCPPSEGRFEFGIPASTKGTISKGPFLLSGPLRLTEEERRTEVHWTKRDGTLPLQTVSRVDLKHPYNGSMVGHVTIELKYEGKVLLFIVRPTFTIRNASSFPLYFIPVRVLGRNPKLTIPPEVILQHPMTFLPPEREEEEKGAGAGGAKALLLSHNFPDESDEDSASSSSTLTYLGLSLGGGGPFWFHRLGDFTPLFDHGGRGQGQGQAKGHDLLVAYHQSLTVPKFSAAYQKANTLCLEATELELAGVALSLSWTCGSGQVHLTVRDDPCPQVTLHNLTQVPMLLTPGGGKEGDLHMQPLGDPFFPSQYLILYPNTRLPFSFPPSCRTVLLAKLRSDLRDFMDEFKYNGDPLKARTEAQNITSVCCIQDAKMGPKGTLIFPDVRMPWVKRLDLGGGRAGGNSTSEYLCLGAGKDAKVSVELIGAASYVFIENLSSEEVAAKDVRKRISTPTKTQNKPCGSGKEPVPNSNSGGTTHTLDHTPSSRWLLQQDPLALTTIPAGGTSGTTTSQPSRQLYIYLPKINIFILDDFTSGDGGPYTPLLLLSAQDLFFSLTPAGVAGLKRYRALWDRAEEKFRKREAEEFTLLVGELRVEAPRGNAPNPRGNGTGTSGTADFPVVMEREGKYEGQHDLLIQGHGDHFTREYGLGRLSWREYRMIHLSRHDKHKKERDSQKDPCGASPESWRELFPAFSPLLSLTVTRGQDSLSHSSLEDVSVKVLPFILRIEERQLLLFSALSSLLHFASSETEKVMTLGGQGQGGGQRSSSPPPEEIRPPISFRSLRIAPLEVLLTLRLSSPFYFALDSSRIKLPELNLCDQGRPLTSYELGAVLSSHYIWGAIFVVPFRFFGSLELLGSPGPLVETLGGGLRDLVVLPYQGLRGRGARGFLWGMSSGVASLLRSCTEGSLTSLTNLAFSVSRNLDRLSLTEGEMEGDLRSSGDIGGVRDGVTQGLTSFGLRLLGGIGGLAQHPMESILRDGASPTSFLLGLSKGVVGFVARPIGGIVEFFALTGTGVLKSAGWREDPKVRWVSEEGSSSASAPNSLLKVLLALDLGGTNFTLLIQGMELSSSSASEMKAVSLLLTDRALYVFQDEEEEGAGPGVACFPLPLLAPPATPPEEEGGQEGDNLLVLRTAPPPKDEGTFREERLLSFLESSVSQLEAASTAAVDTQSAVPVGDESLITIFPPPRPEPQGLPATPTATPTVPLPLGSAAPSSSPTMFTARGEDSPSLSGQGSSQGQGQGHDLLMGSQGTWAQGQGQGGQGQPAILGSFLVSPAEKAEFNNALNWLKKNQKFNN